MNNSIITLNVKNYFEGAIHILGWFFGFLSILLLFISWMFSPLFFILFVIIVFSNYRITIDTDSKQIEDYLFILGLKAQKETFKYTRLDYIYFTESKFTQRLNMRAASTTTSGTIYSAYLKSDVENHFLGEDVNIDRLKKKVVPFAKPLQLQIRYPD